MREESIRSGVQFLQHPNVQSTPMSERVAFLEQKGLTNEETQQALERYQSAQSGEENILPTSIKEPLYTKSNGVSPLRNSAPTALATSVLPLMIRNPFRHFPVITKMIRLVATISSIVGMASMLLYTWNFAVYMRILPSWCKYHSLFPSFDSVEVVGARTQESEKENQNLSDEIREMTTVMQNQTQKLLEISQEIDSRPKHEDTMDSMTIQVLDELRNQVAELKMLIHEPNIELGESNGQDPNLSLPGVMLEEVSHMESPRIDKVLTVLDKLQRENSVEQLQDAFDLMIMYVKNLLENPTVPRYRKIATGNVNYKTKIEPIKHHRELLETIGFEPYGMNLEWKWYTSKSAEEREENAAILQAVLSTFQSACKSKELKTGVLRNVAKDAFERQLGASTHTENIHFDDLQDDNAHRACDSATDKWDTFLQMMEKKTLETTEISSHPTHSGNFTEKNRQQYPESFAGVIKMVQNGQQPPDIKKFEEKLSEDSAIFVRELKESQTTQHKNATFSYTATPST